MNRKPIENARDADLRLSLAALRRAAQRAREVAQQTGTTVVISRDGVIEYLTPLLEGSAHTVQVPSARRETP